MGEKDKDREKDKAKAGGLTKLELKVMQAVWRVGGGTVTTVQEEMGGELAYTTVQTMLNILVRKGKLRRHREGRAFLYMAAETEAKARKETLRDLIDRMFGGRSEELVMSLLKSREINTKKLAELAKQFDKDRD
ncbi:MAG: BlaI/MecI/CopY family transcriptional regulator [Terracidiphilus sp.]|nr:BlaI/MecI/CopY family transcriptional regulator [Terracidiphilus sp.]